MLRKLLTFALLFALLPACLISCSSISDAEAAVTVNKLVDKSVPLNDIFFGEGLPYTPSALSSATEAAAQNADTDISTVIYHPVSDDAPYKSIDELKSAAAEIFTPGYCEIIYTIAFTGVAGETDENGEYTVGTVYARYIEDYGKLTVNSNYKNPLPHRSYDLTSTEIIKATDRFITAQIDSFIDGKFDCKVTVELVNTEDGWRIDSPTY